MNTIGKKLVSSTLALTTGAWLLGASFLVPVALAQTTSDLQAQIAALLAQITQLQAQLNAGSQAPATFSFTRNLTVGSTGDDVKALQVFLNSHGVLVSGGTGAGSPGHESMYFGTLTKAALAQWQGANGVSPAVGYFGPITRAKIASLGGYVPPGGTLPPGVSGVSLALDNPAAGTVVISQSQADLAHFNFSGNYTVTNVTLKRIGISADTSLTNVFLFDGGQRITDAASVSAGSLITFNNPSGLFSVSGQKTIAVKADLLGAAGESLGVQLISFTISGGSANTVNLSGNLFNVANATLAAVALSATSTAGASDPGNDILIWQGTATVSTRDVVMNRLALRQLGSINASDIRNFRLLVDGVAVGSAVANQDSNGVVTFSNLGKALTTGSRIVKVLADVIGGSSRTVQLSLRGAYDFNVTDTQYNVNPAVTATGGFPFGPASFTVNSGSMSVVKTTDSPSSNVTLNGSDVTLAKYTFTAYGEPIKVETLKVSVLAAGGADATSTLRNGRVLVNGSQYGSTATIGLAATPTSFTTNFIVNPGSPVTVEVRADVFNNNGGGVALAGTNTLKITLKAGSSNGTPQVSLTPTNVPTGDTDGNAVTISSGALSLTKNTNYGNQSTVIPQTAFKLADFNLSNGNVEDVNVNTLTLTYTASGTLAFDDLQDVYVKYGANQTTIKGTPTASDSFSVSFTVGKNSSLAVQVYGTIKSTGITNGDAVTPTLAITANTASGQTASVAATPGQKITGVTGGTYTASIDNSSPVSTIVDDSGSVTTLIAKVQTVNDGANITALTVTITDPSAVASFDLVYDGTTVVSAKPAATSVAVTGLNIQVPANATKLLSVKLNMGPSGVGVGAGTTGGNITTGISSFTATSLGNGSVATITGTPTGNATYVYKAIPTITRNALPTSVLTLGTQTVADFTIDPGSTGSLGWGKLLFTITTSTATGTMSIASAGVGSTLYDVTAGTYVNLDSATSSGSGFTVIPTTEQPAHRYQLKVTVNSTTGLSSGDTVQFQLARPTTSFVFSSATSTLPNLATTTASFVWTDQSAASHSKTTTDWTPDFLVKNLPLDTWVMTR